MRIINQVDICVLILGVGGIGFSIVMTAEATLPLLSVATTMKKSTLLSDSRQSILWGLLPARVGANNLKETAFTLVQNF